MKISRIFAGVLFIAAAVLILLGSTGVVPALGDLSFWRITGAVLFGCLAVHQIIGRSVFAVLSLAFTFMMLEPNIATALKLSDTDMVNNWVLFGCAALVMIGLAVIFPQRHTHTDKNRVTVNRFSGCERFIDAANINGEVIKNRYGETVVRFENTGAYTGNKSIRVENYMGAVKLYVSAGWQVKYSCSGVASVMEKSGVDNPTGPVLEVTGKNSFGHIEIVYR